jgi:hypothetical protein
VKRSLVDTAWTSASALAGSIVDRIGASRLVRFEQQDETTNRGAVSEAELQEDLQRFASDLCQRLVPGFLRLSQGDDPKVRVTALRHAVALFSSAFDIVTEGRAEVGLLDMVTFGRLNREIMSEHWVPKVYGPGSEDLLAVFVESERGLLPIEDKILTKAQQRSLDELIRSWRDDHRDLIYVSWVRLADVSKRAGIAEESRSKAVASLLLSVTAAVDRVDQGLLLADRALFLAHRMPTLVRMQARLGAQEVVADVFHRLEEVRAPIASATRKLLMVVAGSALAWWGGHYFGKRLGRRSAARNRA